MTFRGDKSYPYFTRTVETYQRYVTCPKFCIQLRAYGISGPEAPNSPPCLHPLHWQSRTCQKRGKNKTTETILEENRIILTYLTKRELPFWESMGGGTKTQEFVNTEDNFRDQLGWWASPCFQPHPQVSPTLSLSPRSELSLNDTPDQVTPPLFIIFQQLLIINTI